MSANKRMTAERLVAATSKRRANPAKQAGGVSYAVAFAAVFALLFTSFSYLGEVAA